MISSSSPRKKSKVKEMSRCFLKSETQPTMSLLSANAATFIDLFDSGHYGIKQRVQKCQKMSNVITALLLFTAGVIGGGFWVLTTTWEVLKQLKEENYDKVLFLLGMSTILVIGFAIFIIYDYNECLDDFNLFIGEFRKTVFLLTVELGKLKQRCEDVKWSVEDGLEKENLERLEKSIEELLCWMEKLTVTVTVPTMDDVLQEHVGILHELEKMKVHLSFYRRTNEEPRAESWSTL